MFIVIRLSKTFIGLFIFFIYSSNLFGQDPEMIKIQKANSFPPSIKLFNSPAIEQLPKTQRVGSNTLPSSKNFQSFPYLSPARTQSPANSNCRDSSFLKIFEADNRAFNFSTSAKTHDGGIVISGYGRNKLLPPPYTWYTVITKFDSIGQHIWSKELQSDVLPGRGLIAESISVLSDGSILISGWHDNPLSSSSPTPTVDFFIAKLTANGDLTWLKTFHSLMGNGCTTSNIRYAWAAEGVAGELYIGATIPNCPDPRYLLVFKLNNAGNIIWQYSFTGHFTKSYCMGIFFDGPTITVVNRGEVIDPFGVIGSVDLLRLNSTTGSYVSHKSWQPDLPYPSSWHASFLNWTPAVVKLNNGNYCVYGNTFGDFFNPLSANLPHFSVLEFNNNCDFVKGYTINSPLASNGYESKIKVDRFGKVIYSLSVQLNYPDEDKYYGIADNGAIQHQRKKQLTGLEVFYDNAELFDDGSVAYINTLSTVNQSNFYLNYALMHVSDTGSECLGMIDNFSNTSPINYKPYLFGWTAPNPTAIISTNNQNNNVTSINYTAPPPCYQKTFCDTLKIHGEANSCDLLQDFTFTAFKNIECGSEVNWVIDTSVLQSFQVINDTTVVLRFDQTWQGWLYAKMRTSCGELIDSVLLTIYDNSPGPVNIGPDTAICQSNSITLNARRGYTTYLWNNGVTDSLITVTGPGTYYVDVTDACGNFFSDTVVVSLATPVPVSIGPDRVKCNADTLRLQAPSGFVSYAWSPNYNINTTTTQQVIVNPAVDTIYTLIAEKTPGCFGYDTVRITVNTSPPIDLGVDKSFCTGDSLLLDAGTSFSQYQWSNGITTQQIMVNTAGDYSVTGITAEGCKSFDTLTVLNVYPLPVVSLNKDSTLCTGDQKTLHAGNGFANYSWNTGSTASSIIVNNIGIYAVTVTDSHGCKGTDTTEITVLLPQPTGFLGPDTSICSYRDIELKSMISFDQYTWSTGSINSSIIVKQPGVYWLQVKDDNSCIGKDTILVDPKDCGKGFYIPTAFTPNNDGKNDLLKPILLGNVVRYHFWVYNRWGELIFETTDVTKGWNGMYKGQTQGSGVFVWLCTYQFENETPKKEKGTFVLIR
jgi:gliding motility-associated-like protein